jgi:hypothetical protein
MGNAKCMRCRSILSSITFQLNQEIEAYRSSLFVGSAYGPAKHDHISISRLLISGSHTITMSKTWLGVTGNAT